jgi:hypothetical protein
MKRELFLLSIFFYAAIKISEINFVEWGLKASAARDEWLSRFLGSVAMSKLKRGA